MLKKILPFALAANTAFAASISVDPNDIKQEILGFGGGSVYYQGWITALGSKTQEALYDTAFTGLNLSILRLGNWLQDEEAGVSDDDITIVKAAKKRLGSHLKIEMSSWSAPGSLKPSGSVDGKDGISKSDKTLNKSANDKYGKYAYTEFASWWKRSIAAYKKAGIEPDYISLQNEPDMEAAYAETLFEPSETTEIAGYKEALNAVYDAVKGDVKILGPEPLGIGYNNFQKYMNELDDSKLDGYAYHLYHAGEGKDNAGDNYLAPENFRNSMKDIATSYSKNNKPIIMTEFCNMLDQTREEDMVGLAHIMQVGFTDGNLAGYIAWELFWGEGRGQLLGVCTKNWGSCKEDKIVVGPEYHALRHYSKFVNPGWNVVATNSGDKGIYTVAFRSADCDSLSLITINTNSTETTITPNISDYNAIYAVQSVENGEKSKEIPVSDSYTLPKASITTIVYSTDNVSGLKNCRFEEAEGITLQKHFATTHNVKATLFDMNGNVIWHGLQNQAINSDRHVILNIPKGSYILKTTLGTFTVTK